MGRSWPLTGRAEELRFIEAASRRVGRPRGVVLAGAAGVGKTRLAREALSVLARAPALALAVAQVRGQLGLQRPLQDDPDQLAEHRALAGQPQPPAGCAS